MTDKTKKSLLIGDVRRLAEEDRIVDTTIKKRNNGYILHFQIREEDNTINASLRTYANHEPRKFKKALTYLRLLKNNGINTWNVEQ